MSTTIEIAIDGTLYRCYRARGGDALERYIVAGVGSVAIAADTGAIVELAPVINEGERLLTKLATLIQRVSCK